MDNGLYEVTVTCPVCSKKIKVTKVKSRACKVISRDSDFYVHYETVNPIFYDVWVCGFCGYAALRDKFPDISYTNSKVIKEEVAPRWSQRSFAGERDIDNALEAFKLALFELEILKNSKASDFAKICMRIAWIYRMKNDERENEFLNFALKHYINAYENESFPIDKLDEITCTYMIGELNRRVGNPEEAVKWFSKIISSPEGRKRRMLMEYTREQYLLAKEQINIENGD